MPEFSVITPMYNCASTIERTLDCFFRQDIDLDKDLELILINDGSTDETMKKVQPYLDQYPFIHCFSYSNAGVSTARNRGLEKASGEYIAFLDSDDEYADGYFGKLKKIVEGKHYDLIVNDFAYRNKEQVILSSAGLASGAYSLSEHPELLRAWFNSLATHAMSAKVYSSSLLRDYQISYDNRFSVYEDALFGLTALMYAEDVYYLNEVNFYYNIDTAGSLMHSHKKDYVEAMNTAYAKIDELIAFKKWSSAENDWFDLKYIESTVDMFCDELKTGKNIRSTLHELQNNNRFRSDRRNTLIPAKFLLYRYMVEHHWDSAVVLMMKAYWKNKNSRKK